MSSVESTAPGFSSSLLVADMSARLDNRIQAFPENRPLTLAFPMASPDAPSASYGLQALAYGNRAKVSTEIWLPKEDGGFDLVTDAEELRERARAGLWVPKDHAATVDLVRGLGERPDIDGIVPLLGPHVPPEYDEAIRYATPVALDHDSISPENPVAPATPVGMVKFMEHIARRPLASTKGRIAILGRGKLVGGPLADQVLPEFNVDMDRVTVFDRREEIEASYRLLERGDFRWIFSAFPAAAKILRLARRAVLVDAGYGIGPDGRAGGNAHPNLLRQSATRATWWACRFSRTATAFRDGTGPVTIAEVYERAAENRILRAAMGSVALHGAFQG